MLRLTVTAVVVAFAAVFSSSASASPTVSATTVGLAYERPPGNGSTCAGVTVSMPPSDTTHVANVVSVDLPANTVVLFEHCNSTSSEYETLNASNPSTWAVAIDWPCVSFRINKTDEELDCKHKSITVEWVQLSDYCKSSNASVSVCKGSGVTPSSSATKALSPLALIAATVTAGLATTCI